LVFGRNPSYDASADPVVRVTAGQIRKRLTQYYSEPEHQGEIRIVLPTGSYVPQFYLPRPLPTVISGQSSNEVPVAEEIPEPSSALASMGRPRKRKAVFSWHAVVGVSVLSAVISIVALLNGSSNDGLQIFWRPILDSDGQIVLCIQPGNSALRSAGQDPMPQNESFTEQDIRIALRVAAAVPRVRDVHFQDEGSATLETFRSGPVILIGTGPSAWTDRVGEMLHFAVVRQGAHVSIIDRRSPIQVHWTDGQADPGTDDNSAFALVARYFDPMLGQPVVLVIGTSAPGTVAGIDLITNRRSLDTLFRQTLAGSPDNNFEAVVAATVMNHYTGAPKVVATRFW
jgi:hypothetical protein